MPERRPASQSGGSRLGRLLAERQVYVRDGAQPYFVTVTRRARLARLAGLALLFLAVAGLAAATALGQREREALRRELAVAPRPESQAAPATPPAPEGEVGRLRADLQAERAARERAEAELGQERAAREVAARSREAELEAARTRIELLSQAARERPPASAGPEPAARAPDPELAALRGRGEAAGRERDAARAELAAARREAEAGLATARAEQARLAGERDRLRAELEQARAEAAGLRRERDQAPAATAAAATVVPVGLQPGPAGSDAVALAKAGRDVPAELSAALARVAELDAALADVRRRNADLEGYLGRRAPPPPASAPR